MTLMSEWTRADWDAAAEADARRTEDRWQADLETQEQDDDTDWAAYDTDWAAYDAAEDRALDILHGIA